ncbi:glutamine amidotransferase [Legionella geestiana]|uniref:Glutamine amidotransferase n=1 Tax=Legionella geestiana TaxID=45065 RepID=A0A0W0TLL2_9GAMM|nr:class II glutamine amidotransferase [Legionella geestiana]KTC96494.1 glutamine amidotransferase [Legionella geestiana]QBS12535.1 class II glutamine amidotransferase [Legionella geestiana]QDQ39749.1 class II glutamine amidotransferase [Legionella geestiana]STX55018.1 glutamine amidotransferase [Legionella geestiana]
MCRFVAYLGEPLLLETALVKPENSLIAQSLKARETQFPTNGDGFGVGWYAPELNPEPGLFTSISPAWNDRNLLHLTARIKSPCFFGHVRAAETGNVNLDNCHPFARGRWMLMHNGDIGNFSSIKRHLRRMLDDDIYNWIQGSTDSEHFFALFLQLCRGRDVTDIHEAANVLRETVKTVNVLVEQYGQGGVSFLNICLTDGERMLATRYTTSSKEPSLSLHYFAGTREVPESGSNGTVMRDWRCVLLASEKLNCIESEWGDIPHNHMILVDRDLQIELQPL